MLEWLTNVADRQILIGRPNLTLKDINCGNITCGQSDKFKKYKSNSYLCECGYILYGEYEVEETHKVKFYCKAKQCPESKGKMDKTCLQCELIGER